MNPTPYLRPLTFTISLVIAAACAAQTTPSAPAATPASPTPSAAPTAAPAAGSTPAAAPGAPARGAGTGRGARGGPPPGPAADLEPWPRPANGAPLFSDDFEGDTLNTKMWLVKQNGNATATITQDNVAHGKNALKITYPAGARGAYAMLTTSLPESLREHFYGRAYVFLHAVPAQHSVLMLAGSPGYPKANWLEIGTDRGMFQPSVQAQDPTPTLARGETVGYQAGTLPAERWFCLEWELLDKPDRVVLWVDGQLYVNHALVYNDVSTGLIGGFFEYTLGFRTFAPAGARETDVYFDDVAFGDKPIGQLSPVAAPTTAPTAAPAPAAKPATP